MSPFFSAKEKKGDIGGFINFFKNKFIYFPISLTAKTAVREVRILGKYLNKYNGLQRIIKTDVFIVYINIFIIIF